MSLIKSFLEKGKLVFLLYLLHSCVQKNEFDIVLEDFEGGVFSENWEIQGTAFHQPVNIDAIQDTVFYVHGKYFAYSSSQVPGTFKGSGKLITNSFTINRNFLRFLIAGHEHETRSSVNLIIDNTIVKSATGKNDLIFREIIWDIRKYEGKEAYLEIVDALSTESTQGFDNRLLVDRIVLSDDNRENKKVFEDFESGTFNSWHVIGDAFREPNSNKNVYYPIIANGYKGDYYAFSFGDSHDLLQGKLVSRPFKIEYDKIQFLIGGGSHVGKTCINLVVDQKVVRSATGNDNGDLRLKEWDVTNLQGSIATLEIVDQYSGPWGHIIVDEILFINTPWYQRYAKIAGVIVVIFLITIFILLKIRKKSRIEISDVERKTLEQLKNQIIINKDFKNQKFNLTSYSKSLGLDSEKIEQLFLRGEGKPFLAFINELRVEEFKNELQDPKNKAYTMIYIANQCGFSSKTSFYRIFKEVTKITPTDYKKQL